MEEFADLCEDRLKKFETLLRDPKNVGRRAYVVSSHYDPDSIACVMMTATLLRSFGFIVEICLPGKPDNYRQNIKIVEKYHLERDITLLDEAMIKKINPEDLVVFVDTPSVNDARFPAGTLHPNIVIDHHTRPAEMVEKDEEWFWYASCGACASMVTKLMIMLGVFKDIKDKELKIIATLGVLGILGDAKKLTSRHTTSFDYDMVAFLRRYADQEAINDVSFSEYDESFLDALGISRDRWERRGTVLLFRVDEPHLRGSSEDNILKAAEFLMRIGEVQTLFAWMIQRDKIIIKARNYDKSISLDSELKRMFGQKNGGAKDNSSGAAFVDLSFFSNPPDGIRNQFLSVCEAFMRQKIFGK
ncbi:MAG TPA: DHH family phosphoesterase [Candidatus Paceibacterota bacterium]|nr:DHH family phosphoesterase [Candidatus Paceibacterota bacterium]